jgi:iron complex outermembrane receptor protein
MLHVITSDSNDRLKTRAELLAGASKIVSLGMFGILLFVVTMANAVGDDKPKTDPVADPVFELGTVTVYGTKPDGADLMPVQIDAATINLLEKNDVAQALSTLPGVTLTRIGARNEETVFVRGFSRVETPIFIDGVPAYVPYDGYVDLGRFTTYDVGTISVAKGYSSVLYGPNTMGGAINLVSRQPQSAFEGQLSGGAFSGDGYETSLNLGTKQNLWFAQFGASYVDQNTFPLSSDFVPVKAQADGDRNNAAHTDWKVSGKIAYTPNATDEYAVGFVDQNGDKGNPPYTGAIASNLRYWQWPQWDKQTVYYVSNTRIGDSSYIKPRLYYDWYENTLDQYSDGTYSKLLTGSFAPSMYHDHSYGTSIEAGTDLLPGNTLKGAVYYKLDHHDEQVVGQPHYIDEDRTDSVALEDTWHFSPAWDLQTGISYDSRKALRADQVNPDNTPVALTTFDDFNPEVGLFYKLGALGTFHATIAHKSRFPTIKERYSYKFNTAFPNPELKPENVTHYELGYDGEIARRLTLHTSVYYSRIQDAIETVSNVNGTTRSQNQNVGTVDNAGLDLGLDYACDTWLKLGASYTFLHQENVTNPAIKATDTPVHSGSIYADIQLLKWLSVVPGETFSSWRYAYTNGQKIGGYATTDLKLVARLGNGVSISAGVGNLFDKNYELEDGYPEPGRTWYVNARYEF